MNRGKWFSLTVAAALAVVLAAPADAQRRRDREVLEELETRVEVLERQIRADNVVALINAQDELRREIQILRDLVERLAEDLRSNAELRRSQYAALEERLAALEAAPLAPDLADAQAPADTPGDVSEPGTANVAGTGAAVETQGGVAAGSEANYQQARALLSEGQYEAAAAEFLRYLGSGEAASLAANARYWLGETYYVQGLYEQAGAEFSRVVRDHPNSGKVADAMLKLAYTQDEQGDTAGARVTLERVRQDYAGADAANLATLRLAQIEARPR